MDWGGANSRFLGLVSVWAARSFDQTALRPSVIKRIRQIDVKYITHITSFGVTAWTRVTAWTCMCELPRCTVHWTRISIHWILDFKQLLLLLIIICGLVDSYVFGATRDGKTTARGSHVARQTISCGPPVLTETSMHNLLFKLDKSYDKIFAKFPTITVQIALNVHQCEIQILFIFFQCGSSYKS